MEHGHVNRRNKMKKITIYILLTLMMSTIFIISPNAETICADGYYLFNDQCLSCSQKKHTVNYVNMIRRLFV